MVSYAIILYMIVINIIEKLRVKSNVRNLVNQAVQSEIMLKIIAWQVLVVTKNILLRRGRNARAA